MADNNMQDVTVDQGDGGQQNAPVYAADPGPSQSKSSAPAGAAGVPALISPPGILRMVEWFFALIAFSAMADQDGYDKFDVFKWAVGAGVLAWLYTSACLAFLFLGLHQKISVLPLVVFIADCLFWLFTFSAGVGAAAKCEEKVSGTDVKTCDNNADKAKASAAFHILLSFLFVGSAFFSFKRWRA